MSGERGGESPHGGDVVLSMIRFARDGPDTGPDTELTAEDAVDKLTATLGSAAEG